MIVVSCSGKLHSVSLQLRGQAANSRAPSWSRTPPDYAPTPHWCLSNTNTDEVSLQAFYLSHHSIQYSFEKDMGKLVCALPCFQALFRYKRVQSFCATWCSVSTAGLQHIGIARYCLMLSSRCVHVFLFQWQSAMSMKCVPVLSTGKEGLLWCRDLNWSPLTLEDGLWTNTMPLTFAAVSLSACFWCLEAGCVFKATKWIGETWIQFQIVFSFMKEKTDVFCFLSLTLK